MVFSMGFPGNSVGFIGRYDRIPSGKQTVCKLKMAMYSLQLSFPINSMVIFHSCVTVVKMVMISKPTARNHADFFP